MLCSRCGRQYTGDVMLCPLCAVPLRSSTRSGAAAQTAPDPIRPPGIDRTLAGIRQDIDCIDRFPVRPAGFFVRLLAYTIDNLIIGLITLVVSVAVLVVLERSGIRIARDTEGLMGWLWLLYIIPHTALTCMYFIYFHAVTGRTVGKAVCGLCVVTAAGDRPLGWVRSIVRCAGYYLVSFFMYIGFLWIVFNRSRRGWHDYLAGSMVIYAHGSQKE